MMYGETTCMEVRAPESVNLNDDCLGTPTRDLRKRDLLTSVTSVVVHGDTGDIAIGNQLVAEAHDGHWHTILEVREIGIRLCSIIIVIRHNAMLVKLKKPLVALPSRYSEHGARKVASVGPEVNLAVGSALEPAFLGIHLHTRITRAGNASA
eukprot:9473458-Pyramimonas_sp.AAC.3